MDGMDAPGEERIAVVVVTWNSAPLIPDMLESLDKGLDGLGWRLVVADNDSADGTAATLERLAPEARVVRMGRNAGYAAGINAAVAVLEDSTGDITADAAGDAAGDVSAVLVMNPDVRLRPGCGTAMLTTLRRTGAGIVVPRLLDGHGRLITSLRRKPTPLRTLGDAVLGSRRAGRYERWGEAVADEASYRTESTADWAAGSVMLLSRECLNRCGPWDESFFLYSEETEYALRARDRGFTVRLSPAAEAVHLEGDSKVSPRLWTLLTLNRLRLYRRRHGKVSSAAFWLALLVRETSRALLGSKPSRKAAAALLNPATIRSTPGP